MINLTWIEIKNQIDNYGQMLHCKIESNTEGSRWYKLYVYNGPAVYYCELKEGEDDTSVDDITEFESDYQADCNKPVITLDDDNANYARLKIAPEGWAYLEDYFKITTSSLNSIIHENNNGANPSIVTMKFYDGKDIATATELTTQEDITSSCIKTIVDYEPAFTYAMVGGGAYSVDTLTNPVYAFAVGVPDVPAEYGGSVEFIRGIDLKVEGHIAIDGKVPKILPYVPGQHYNKMRFIFHHSVGDQKQLMLNLGYYRP